MLVYAQLSQKFQIVCMNAEISVVTRVKILKFGWEVP